MIRIGRMMALVAVMLSACGETTVEVEEALAPTEGVVIPPTEQDSPLLPWPSPIEGGPDASSPSSIPDTVVTAIPGDANAAPESWTSFRYPRSSELAQGFVLHYPRSWALAIRTWDFPDGQREMLLVLEEEGFEIEIGQMAYGGGGGCPYPGEGGSASDSAEIERENAVSWRRTGPYEASPGVLVYRVCEFDQVTGYEVNFTSIGWIEFRAPHPDQLMLREFEEILRRIEVLE